MHFNILHRQTDRKS